MKKIHLYISTLVTLVPLIASFLFQAMGSYNMQELSSLIFIIGTTVVSFYIVVFGRTGENVIVQCDSGTKAIAVIVLITAIASLVGVVNNSLALSSATFM